MQIQPDLRGEVGGLGLGDADFEGRESIAAPDLHLRAGRLASLLPLRTPGRLIL